MPFPNIPNVPGVPALPRDPRAVFAGITLLTSDLISGLLGSLTPQWGIFDNAGSPVIVGDSVIAFDYKQEWSVSDYQAEQGAFASYNKVAIPFSVKLRFACAGSQPRLQAFLDSVAAVAKTLDLYVAVTPEKNYASVNVTHYDYRRTAARGLGLIVVDISLIEIRVTGAVSFTTTKSPTAASTQNTGVVSTIAPTPEQTKAVTSTPSGAGT